MLLNCTLNLFKLSYSFVNAVFGFDSLIGLVSGQFFDALNSYPVEALPHASDFKNLNYTIKSQTTYIYMSYSNQGLTTYR